MTTCLVRNPEYYHQQYEKSTPEVGKDEHLYLHNAKRVALVALPYISLYKPAGNLISLGMNSMRCITSLAYLSDSSSKGTIYETGKALLETTIAIAALAGTVFAYPLGLVISTGHDIGLNCYDAYQSYRQNGFNNKKTLESIAHIANNGIYLVMFFTVSLELVAISFAVQALFTLYRSREEFNKGYWLEGIGHLGMAAIRTNQLMSQVSAIQCKWEMQKKVEQQSCSLNGLSTKNACENVVKTKGFNKNKELRRAAYRGDVEKTKTLLEEGVDIDATNEDGETALHIASYKGRIEVVKILIDAKANIEATNEDGETALHMASSLHTSLHTDTYKGQPEVVKILIDAKADINALDKNGHSPLHSAVRSGRKELVELFLEAKADVNIVAKNGTHALDLATGSYAFPEIVEMLVEAGAKIEIDEGDLQNALHKAVWCKQINTVEKLIAKGANVKDDDLLIRASMYKDAKMVQILLEAGADVNARNDLYGYTALNYAAYYGNIEGIKLLVHLDADINSKGYENRTPAFYAVEGNNLDALKLLWEFGTDINASDQRGSTPLFEAVTGACTFKDYEIVRFLLDHGADVNQPSNAYPVLWQAVFHDDEQMVKMLIRAGADLNAVHPYLKTTALERAEQVGYENIAKILRQSGGAPTQ